MIYPKARSFEHRGFIGCLYQTVSVPLSPDTNLSSLSLFHSLHHSQLLPHFHLPSKAMQMQVIATLTTFSSSFQQQTHFNNLLPKSLFPSQPTKALQKLLFYPQKTPRKRSARNLTKTATTHASLLEAPVLWAGRLCVYYALLKTGLAGSQANPLVAGGLDSFFSLSFFFLGFDCYFFICLLLFLGLEGGGVNVSESGDLGFSKWLENIQGKPGMWLSLLVYLIIVNAM